MSLYKIKEQLDAKIYLVESDPVGTQREMKIYFMDIVYLSKSACQIIESVLPIGYSLASSDIIFVTKTDEGKLYPIEQKLYYQSDLKALKKDNIIEIRKKSENTSFYAVVYNNNISSQCIKLKKYNSSLVEDVKFTDIDISSLKVLDNNYTLLQLSSRIVLGQNGNYCKYDTVSSPFNYSIRLEPGQIINIVSKESFTLQEISNELGTKIHDVKLQLRNILPDGKNLGTGIDYNEIEKRKNYSRVENVSDVSISKSEFFRLVDYLKRPETQCKNILYWKHYVNKVYPSVNPPAYLDIHHNPYQDLIPCEHLDMGMFANIIGWLMGKSTLNGMLEESFKYFHLLNWSEQVRFVQKIIADLQNGKCSLTDIGTLGALVECPQYVNINVQIFIHSLLKLHQFQGMLSNLDLYNIWKSFCPQKSEKYDAKLSLESYIGTNLFCTCKGAIGFNKEDWWQPDINEKSKPVFHLYGNGDLCVHFKPDNHKYLSPTMNEAKANRGFVVCRSDDNKGATSCFRSSKCLVIDAIKNDREYHEQLLYPNGRPENKIEDDDKMLSYDDCPLVSVPSWRHIWAEKYRDKCTSQNPPKATIYLWYNKNKRVKKQFFCEGRTAVDKNSGLPQLHQMAKLPFKWCNGNACFTDIYVSPFNKTQIYEGDINLYSAAIVLQLVKDGDVKAKLDFQLFHSRLNWLNIAAPHFYCNNCNRVLEASSINSSGNFAHAISWFECQNSDCCNNKKQIYISHCWNDKCRSIIDSRETSLCPNNKYICPSCGVCCGEKMFKLKRQAGVPDTGRFTHYEQNRFYCYKCGKEMISQGKIYYCKDHPDVVTKILPLK